MMFQDVINQSELSPEDKKLWHDLLQTVPKEYHTVFFEYVGSDMTKLEYLTKELRSKHDTMAASSPEDLQTIFDDMLRQDTM